MRISFKVRIAVALLVVAHAMILFAGYFAPYPYDEQHREHPYAPPTRIHFFDAAGRFHPRPFVYGPEAQPHPIEFFTLRRLFRVRAPGVLFLLGTDGYGRDIFSRFLYGGRISMATGVLAAFVALAAGALLGSLAGYYAGWVDAVLMRTSELFLALPWLYLLLGVRAALPLHIGPLRTFLLLIAILGGVGWVRPARLIRGVVLSAKERWYVTAARGFGASDGYLIRRHILPSTWSVLVTQASVLIPQYMMAEVTLSFLGLGIAEPVPSWGNLLAEARQYHALAAHIWMLAPGLGMVPVLYGYLAVADFLRTSSDAA